MVASIEAAGQPERSPLRPSIWFSIEVPAACRPVPKVPRLNLPAQSRFLQEKEQKARLRYLVASPAAMPLLASPPP